MIFILNYARDFLAHVWNPDCSNACFVLGQIFPCGIENLILLYFTCEHFRCCLLVLTFTTQRAWRLWAGFSVVILFEINAAYLIELW